MIKRSYIFCLAILLGFIATSQSLDAQSAKITASETEYDFGKIEETGGEVKHAFIIKNDGTAPLELTQVIASCGCTTSQWSKDPIAPGKTAQIEVAYNPSGRPGDFSKDVQVFSNGSSDPLKLVIKGSVNPKPAAPATAPEFSPNEWTHDFGLINEVDGLATNVFRIKNTGTAPLIISHVASSCGCTEPEWTDDPIPPGETGDVVITYDPKNRPGPFKKNVTVYTNVKGGRQKLTITGDVVPKPRDLMVAFHDTIGTVQLEKKSFMFYTIRPKEITTQEIWIRNFSEGNETLAIENVPSYLNVEVPVQLEPHKAERMKITVNGPSVTTKGRMLGKFMWKTKSASGKIATQEIPVAINFIDDFSTMSPSQKANGPSVKLSASQIDFGKVKTGGFLGIGGKRASQQITITNSGKAALNLHSITCDDSRIQITGFNKKVLQPGEKTTLTLLLKPKEVKGSLITELYVVCNDPRGPVRQVRVSAER